MNLNTAPVSTTILPDLVIPLPHPLLYIIVRYHCAEGLHFSAFHSYGKNGKPRLKVHTIQWSIGMRKISVYSGFVALYIVHFTLS